MRATASLSRRDGSPSAPQLLASFVLVGLIATISHLLLIDLLLNEAGDFWNTGARDYGRIARAIATEGAFNLDGIPTAFRPPLYPLFLALTGPDAQVALLLQGVLVGLTWGIVGALAAYYRSSRWTFLWVVPFATLSVPLIGENMFQRETGLFTFLIVVAAAMFLVLEKRPGPAGGVVLGSVLGLASLTRPVAYVGIPFALLLWLRRRSFGTRAAVGFIVIFSLVVLPWGVRNWHTMGRFAVTSSTRGLNLWKGNNTYTDDIYPQADVDVMEELLETAPPGTQWREHHETLASKDEFEGSDYLTGVALRYITSHPLQFLRRAAVKFRALWTPRQVPMIRASAVWVGENVKLIKYSDVSDFFAGVFVLLYVASAFGAWYLRRSPFVLYCAVWFLFLSFLHMVTFGESRFRYPFNVLSVPLAVVGMERTAQAALERIRARRRLSSQ